MNFRYLPLLVFVTVFAGGNCAFAHVFERPLDLPQPQFRAPYEVVDLFLDAVSRGELIVFDRRLNKSMVNPVRVEYVYELESAIPRVKIFSELKQPMPVPGQDGYKLRGVSVILDSEGRIIETHMHIWPAQ